MPEDISEVEIKLLWQELLQSGASGNRDVSEILLELRSLNAGLILYSEIVEAVLSGQIEDSVSAYLINILADVYEGSGEGDFDRYQAINTKDETIQRVLRSVLSAPQGVESLSVALNVLYMLASSDSSSSQLLETVLNEHGELLSNEEILWYRLHYSYDPYQLTEILDELNSKRASEISYAPSTVFEHFYNAALLHENTIKAKDSLRQALAEFVKKTEPSFDRFDSLPLEDQGVVINEYAYGSWIEGASLGYDNLDQYLLDKAQGIESPIKMFALAKFQDNRVEILENTNNYDSFVNDSHVRKVLEKGRDDESLPGFIRQNLRVMLETRDGNNAVNDIDTVSLNLSVEEKRIAREGLEAILKEDLTIDQRNEILSVINNIDNSN